MKYKFMFFPWPAGHKRGRWFRYVGCNTDDPQVGDLVEVIYPSGSKVAARVFGILTNTRNNFKSYQLEGPAGTRDFYIRDAVHAPPVSHTHKRKKQ